MNPVIIFITASALLGSVLGVFSFIKLTSPDPSAKLMAPIADEDSKNISAPEPKPLQEATGPRTSPPPKAPAPKFDKGSSQSDLIRGEQKSNSAPPGGAASAESTGEFGYPDASKVSGDSVSFILKSGDEAKVITDWYKSRINDAGMKTTSFVQTSTNGNVLNSLVGSGNGHEVRVEIKKSSDNSEVSISVSEKSL